MWFYESKWGGELKLTHLHTVGGSEFHSQGGLCKSRWCVLDLCICVEEAVEMPIVGLQLWSFCLYLGGRLGEDGLLRPRRGPGVSSRVCPIVQSLSPTLGLIIRGKELTWEHESRIKRLTATCEKIPSLVNFEFTWNWNLSLDFSIRIDCWVFPANTLWWAAGQSWLAVLHGWAPGSHGIASVRDWLPQKLASLCPEWLELTCQHGLTFGLNKFEMCLKCSRT